MKTKAFTFIILLILSRLSFAHVIAAGPDTTDPFPNQTLMLGGAPCRLCLCNWVITDAAGTLNYSAQSTNLKVATVRIINDTLFVFPVKQGSAGIIITAADEKSNLFTARFTVTVNPACDYNIIGRVTYDNSSATPLEGVKITLSPGNYSAVTDEAGEFAIYCMSNGTYSVSASYEKPWTTEAITASDGLLIALYFIDPLKYPLADLRMKAADVNDNGILTLTDALLILRRLVQLDSSFVKEDWVFTGKTVTVNGSSPEHVDLKGVFAGDVNGSFIPGLSP